MNHKAFPNNQPEIRVIAVSGGTNLIKLGRQHGLAAQKPEYPEFLQYYKAWSRGYREYLLNQQFLPDSDASV